MLRSHGGLELDACKLVENLYSDSFCHFYRDRLRKSILVPVVGLIYRPVWVLKGFPMLT